MSALRLHRKQVGGFMERLDLQSLDARWGHESPYPFWDTTPHER